MNALWRNVAIEYYMKEITLLKPLRRNDFESDWWVFAAPPSATQTATICAQKLLPISTCLSNDTFDKDTKTQSPKFASGHVHVETSHICAYSFKYFAHSAGNGRCCTSIKALRGCMLFCTFHRGDSQCAWLVDQLPHLFVCDIIVAQVAFLLFYFLSPEASHLLIDTNSAAHYSKLNKHEV